MANWKSYLGCWIPQDANARADCIKKGTEWGPNGLDPHTAALNEVRRVAKLAEDNPLMENVTIDNQRKAIAEEENKIRNLLKEQMELARQEDKERKEKMKKLGEEMLSNEMERRAAILAKRQ